MKLIWNCLFEYKYIFIHINNISIIILSIILLQILYFMSEEIQSQTKNQPLNLECFKCKDVMIKQLFNSAKMM